MAGCGSKCPTPTSCSWMSSKIRTPFHTRAAQQMDCKYPRALIPGRREPSSHAKKRKGTGRIPGAPRLEKQNTNQQVEPTSEWTRGILPLDLWGTVAVVSWTGRVFRQLSFVDRTPPPQYFWVPPQQKRIEQQEQMCHYARTNRKPQPKLQKTIYVYMGQRCQQIVFCRPHWVAFLHVARICVACEDQRSKVWDGLPDASRIPGIRERDGETLAP